MRRTALPPLSEAAFMDQVTGLASLCGWKWFHPWLSIKSREGWPDLVFSKPPRLVFAELKKETGQPTAEQYDWLERLRASGQEVYCFWPSDWDVIERVLRG